MTALSGTISASGLGSKASVLEALLTALVRSGAVISRLQTIQSGFTGTVFNYVVEGDQKTLESFRRNMDELV